MRKMVGRRSFALSCVLFVACAPARALNPDLEIRQGDMLALDSPDESWAGIVAFYSIIHVSRTDVVRALRELGRCLRPGGRLLISFHVGDEVLHLDELWDHPVCMDFIFFGTDEMLGTSPRRDSTWRRHLSGIRIRMSSTRAGEPTYSPLGDDFASAVPEKSCCIRQVR